MTPPICAFALPPQDISIQEVVQGVNAEMAIAECLRQDLRGDLSCESSLLPCIENAFKYVRIMN